MKGHRERIPGWEKIEKDLRSLGARVKKFRLLRFPDWPQYRAATKIGVSFQFLNSLEAGRRLDPQLSTFLMLASGLEIGLDALMGYRSLTEEEKTPLVKAYSGDQVQSAR